ncbi:hypothetical protein PVAND_011703 [Polypedilum vanderplanki]|uniref:Peptidase M12B domain-containing protein n=1 Tax=Polypedilum vanderplanki TaxID=319348 RepID=A0A9J6CJF2_POLVA|nr:hypothetical protein PVAND_011703 [Polypedilum vanderplanki]
MTTPQWTKSSYFKLILASFVILCIIFTFIWLSYTIFGTSSLSSQASESEKLSETSNLKSLVESFLKEHPEASQDEDDRRLLLLKSSMPEILQKLPDMKDITEYWIVYPTKTHVPLNPEDLLYESNRNGSSALMLDNKYPHHKTGYYRNKSSKIWDPHPRYEINANGHNFVLELQSDSGHVPTNLEVTHVWQNSNLRRKDEQRDHIEHKECLYNGTIAGDDKARVAVSLCDGMQGYFRTSKGSYFIEPIEEYVDENRNILHLLYKHPPLDGESEKCDVSTSHDQHDSNEEEIDLKFLDDSKSKDDAHVMQRYKRSIQHYQQNSPYQQQLQRHHRQRQQQQYEQYQKEIREREMREKQRRTNSNVRDSRQYHAMMQQPLQQQQYNNNMYHYQHHFQNSMHNVQQKNSDENKEYTIEVLVAVDRKMQEYHGKNLKNYVLTLMSVVSSIYTDASIGNSIKIAVVHIMYIEQDLVPDASFGNGVGVSASGMLVEFCRLKHTHDYQHDTALLLTREQICRVANQKKCDTLGLAELGTMCKPNSCAIVQDNGLSAAFTIAHELGHVIYTDASIGNSIKIAVVHIMYIEQDLVPDASFGNGVGVSASGMLVEFCRLKHTHDYQHDTALLLTREQICRVANQKKCDTLGLAELGTMCKPNSCAIVQDNGLSAAFTIAHELGHV